ELQAGGFAFQTEGQCKARNLEFPIDVSLVGAQVAPKQTSNIPVLGQLKAGSMPVLIEALKDKDGNIVYQGHIKGTLDKPEFFSWKSMGAFLASSLVKNAQKLPDVQGVVDTSKRLLEGSRTDVEKATQGVLEQAGKTGESIRGILPFGKKKD
ncbi:MAG TPA: hypothetical protein PKH07_13985, partial [bacterium]|nr:hypothetical protein [bacterium]